jgi:hypothetical protein
MKLKRLLPLLLLCFVLPATAADPLVQRGRYIVQTSGCNTCHTALYGMLGVVVDVVRKSAQRSHAGPRLVRAAVSGEEKSVVAPCSAIARSLRIAFAPR